MDPLLWLSLAAIVAVVLIVLSLKTLRGGKEKQDAQAVAGDGGGNDNVVAAPGGQQRRVRNLRARAAALRQARAAMGTAGEENEQEEENVVAEPEEENEATPFQKIGTKKLKKIREKAERKAMREQEEAIREDRKKREALREKERKQAEEQEREREKHEEDEQERLRLEKERAENEEYLKLKTEFTVEEEGEQVENEDEAKGIQDFINYIKKEKIVFLENLALEFNLKTQDAIDRVQKLQESGDLTGVIDDRGKFIFISQDELQAVATFIRQRGRVSLAELASSNNSVINLQPESTIAQ